MTDLSPQAAQDAANKAVRDTAVAALTSPEAAAMRQQTREAAAASYGTAAITSSQSYQSAAAAAKSAAEAQGAHDVTTHYDPSTGTVIATGFVTQQTSQSQQSQPLPFGGVQKNVFISNPPGSPYISEYLGPQQYSYVVQPGSGGSGGRSTEPFVTIQPSSGPASMMPVTEWSAQHPATNQTAVVENAKRAVLLGALDLFGVGSTMMAAKDTAQNVAYIFGRGQPVNPVSAGTRLSDRTADVYVPSADVKVMDAAPTAKLIQTGASLVSSMAFSAAAGVALEAAAKQDFMNEGVRVAPDALHELEPGQSYRSIEGRAGGTFTENVASIDRYAVGGNELSAQAGQYTQFKSGSVVIGEAKGVGPVGRVVSDFTATRFSYLEPTALDKLGARLLGRTAEGSLQSDYIIGQSVGKQLPGIMSSQGYFTQSAAQWENYPTNRMVAPSAGRSTDVALVRDLSDKSVSLRVGSREFTLPVGNTPVDLSNLGDLKMITNEKGTFVKGTGTQLFGTGDVLAQRSLRGVTTFDATDAMVIGRVQSASIVKPLTSGSRIVVMPTIGGGSAGLDFGGASIFGDLSEADQLWPGLAAAGAGRGFLSGHLFEGWSEQAPASVSIAEETIYIRPEAMPANAQTNASLSTVQQRSYSQSFEQQFSNLSLGSSLKSQTALTSQTQLSTSLQTQQQTQQQTQLQTQLSTSLSTMQTPQLTSGAAIPVISIPIGGGRGFGGRVQLRNIVESPSGGRGRERVRRLPTADLFSIERGFRRTGRVQFAYGPRTEAAFAHEVATKGPFARFPTADAFKRSKWF